MKDMLTRNVCTHVQAQTLTFSDIIYVIKTIVNEDKIKLHQKVVLQNMGTGLTCTAVATAYSGKSTKFILYYHCVFCVRSTLETQNTQYRYIHIHMRLVTNTFEHNSSAI
jgi:hypothetical protein